MKTANKSTLACMYTRARALARTPLRTLACAWMVLIALVIGAGDAWGQVIEEFYSSGNGNAANTWSVPTGVTEVKVNAIGGGGGGGKAKSTRALDKYASAAGGGGGGGYSFLTRSTDPGSSFVINVGAVASPGVDGNPSYVNYSFNGTSLEIVRAGGGSKGNSATSNGTNANGGGGGSGNVIGGNGAKGNKNDSKGGGGGGSAGPGHTSIGTDLQHSAVGDQDQDGGDGYGKGGNGGTSTHREGYDGQVYGGGGGGGYARGFVGAESEHDGGSGAEGYVWIEYINATATQYQPVTCYNGSDGKIQIKVTEGWANNAFEYTITGPENNNKSGNLTTTNPTTITGFKAGKYTVTVKHTASGLTNVKTVTITQPEELEITSAYCSKPVTCHTDNLIPPAEGTNPDKHHDGAITVTAQGGTGNLTYTLTPSQSNNSITNSNGTATFTALPYATNYSVTVRDTKGCEVSENSITVGQPAKLEVSGISRQHEDCSHNGSVTMTIAGSHPDYRIDWVGSTAEGFKENVVPSTIKLNNLISQSYTITVTDAEGCYATLPVQTIDPREPWEPTITQPLSQTKCNDMTFTFTPAEIGLGSETEPITYHWEVSGSSDVTGYTSPGAGTSLSETLHNAAATSQTVIYTVTAQRGLYCYSEPFEASVTVLPGGGSTVSFSMDDISDVCPGSSFDIPVTFNNVGSGATASWKFNDVTKSAPVSANEQVSQPFDAPEECMGVYTYEVTVNDGTCSATKTAQVTVKAPNLTILESQYGSETVTCMSAVVAPHEKSGYTMPTFTSSCGNYTTPSATHSADPVITLSLIHI